MRVTMRVHLSNIICDKKPPLDAKTLEFAKLIESGYIFPPIKVERLANGAYKLLDGRHRFYGHKLAGKDTISVTVGVPQDPSQFKPLVHGPDKPRVQASKQPLERKPWLEQ